MKYVKCWLQFNLHVCGCSRRCCLGWHYIRTADPISVSDMYQKRPCYVGAFLFRLLMHTRGLDVNKRTITTHSCNLLYWPQYEQLSLFYLFYWPHLGPKLRSAIIISACFRLSRYDSLVNTQYSPLLHT